MLIWNGVFTRVLQIFMRIRYKIEESRGVMHAGGTIPLFPMEGTHDPTIYNNPSFCSSDNYKSTIILDVSIIQF